MPRFKDRIDFRPDYTPQQMFKLGTYGGSYFRPIYSSVAKKNISGDWKEFSYLKKNPNDSPVYDPKKNYYKVKAGQTLEYWQKKRWIKAPDYRGWIQFYCRFHKGRRIPEVDNYQIKRALKVLLRFGQRKTLTPKIKQTLLHWGWNPDKDHTKYIEQIKKNKWAHK